MRVFDTKSWRVRRSRHREPGGRRGRGGLRMRHNLTNPGAESCDNDPGAAFTIEVAILRTNAELECVEAAEARAGHRLIDLSRPAEQAAASGEAQGLRATQFR